MMMGTNCIQRITQLMWSFYTICRTRPQDALSFAFLVSATLMTYIYGTFHLLPTLLAEFPLIFLIIGASVTSWLCIGVLGNLILIQIRNSSIRNKILIQPLVKPPPTFIPQVGADNSEQFVKERTKYMGQQFMAKPFGEDEPWHICGTCEIFVPPKAWHCHHCKTCIFRRDHHCIFAMACIGEENHSNFLGLLFYLGCGSTLATIVNMTHTIYFTDTIWWLYIIKAFVPFYILVFDFSIIHVLAGVNLIGQFAAWFILLWYMKLAASCQTSADSSRGINQSSELSVANLKEMLGPNPFLRIIWPFHTVYKKESSCYKPQVSNEITNRKGM